MNHRSLRVVVALAVAAAAGSTVATGQSAPSYRQIAIPGISNQGYDYVFPADINNHGVVVGYLSRLPGFVPVRGFLWDGHGPTQDLGDLGVYEYVDAKGINDADQVVGDAEVADPRDPLGHTIHAFFWQEGVMTDLPPLGGDSESHAVAIDELGNVLVWSYDAKDPAKDRYYLWSSGSVDPIGHLSLYPGGPAGSALSMNSSRQIVGSALDEAGQEHAFLWDDGTMFDLGLAPGDDFYSVAYKINEAGTIVGESAAFDAENGHGARSQGVVWQGPTIVRTIAPLPGGYFLSPLGVNLTGTVVGFSGFPSSAIVSFGGPAIDLNTLVASPNPQKFLYEGRDVNDLGEIVVDGQFGCCGYLLEPH